MPAYYYLRERLGHRSPVSHDYLSESEVLAAQGHSELLEVCVDSGQLRDTFGFWTPKPRIGQRPVDPAWAMTMRKQITEWEREYYRTAG